MDPIYLYVSDCKGERGPSGVGFSGFGEFDGVEVFCGCFVPVHCISFVDGVDSAFLGDTHLL